MDDWAAYLNLTESGKRRTRRVPDAMSQQMAITPSGGASSRGAAATQPLRPWRVNPAARLRGQGSYGPQAGLGPTRDRIDDDSEPP